jgi:hypothetical protein
MVFKRILLKHHYMTGNTEHRTHRKKTQEKTHRKNTQEKTQEKQKMRILKR